MEPSVFDGVAMLLSGLVPDDLGEMHIHAHRYGIKVWFGSVKPTRDHYEAQVIGKDAVPDAKVIALEVGFHAEHPKEADNEALLAHLLTRESDWRGIVGDEPVAGPFLGRAEHWRRLSETWPDPNLSDPELPFEIAARLTDFVTALEPLRRSAPR